MLLEAIHFKSLNLQRSSNISAINCVGIHSLMLAIN